jgi:hypothetical protein
MRDRIIEAMAIDIARKWNARIPARQIAKELLTEIPELRYAMEAREEKMVRERKMRG